MADELPAKIVGQLHKAGLPTDGPVPFVPRTCKNHRGDLQVERAAVMHGPKRGKVGYVDTQGRIWVKDRAHAGNPDHWDVQIDDGHEYFRVDLHGNRLA